MRINPNGESGAAAGLGVDGARVRASRPKQDEPPVGGAERLARALEQLPAVRAEKVARAKSLVEDPSYPPDSVLGKVAGLLAENIQARDRLG